MFKHFREDSATLDFINIIKKNPPTYLAKNLNNKEVNLKFPFLALICFSLSESCQRESFCQPCFLKKENQK